MDLTVLTKSAAEAGSLFKGIAEAAAAAGKSTEKATEKSAESALDRYKSYARQRLDIEQKYTKELAALEAARTPDNGAEVDASLALARRKQRDELSKIDLTELKDDTNWDVLFANLDKISAQALGQLRDRLRELLDAQDSLSPEALKVLADGYDKLAAKVSKLSPGNALKAAYGDYKTAGKEVKSARKDVKSATGTDEETAAQERLTQALNKRRASQLAVNEAIKGCKDQAGDALGAANAVVDTLEGFGVEVPESIKGVLTGAGQVIEGLGSIDMTKPFSIITGAFKMIGGLGKTILSIFNHDGKKEKEIQRLQKEVDKLGKSYEKLGEALDDSYSSDSADIIREQDANLRQQKELIEQQIAAEQGKKKTDKGKISQWNAAIEQIDKDLAQTKNRIIEAVIGEDVKSAINDFASAYVDAWASGEDRAASMKDVVRKMVKSAVTELVKSRLSGEVQEFMAFLAAAVEDGILTDAEQKSIDEWEQRLYDKADGISDTFDKYLSPKDPASDASAGNAPRGIATASQASVDENNGLLTSIQYDTNTICGHVRTMAADSGRMLGYLSGIHENTGANVAELRAMKKDISFLRNTMNDMAVKGITIKK